MIPGQLAASSGAALAARERKKVLQERARVLAREPVRDHATPGSIEILEFALARERYAVEIRWVGEVHPFKDLTPLPGTPAFILGIVTARGRLLAVLDLKKFFELPEAGLTDLHRLIVVQQDEVEVGLLADVVVGVRTVPLDALQPALPTLTALRQEYLKGVTGEGLVVLDAAKMLADPKLIVNEEVET